MPTFDPADIETHPARQFTLRNVEPPRLTVGDRLSDRIAATVGSWRFIIIQSTILVLWIALNVVGWVQHWDPYPFILLNLALSFQAAFTAPILMMAQNRQAVIDRQKAQLDYDVNLRAELDIEALHQKLDLLREEDIGRLIRLIELLTRERLGEETVAATTKGP
ncbi:MAG: DUF1003 domain-containing protein [Devosia sp.]|uniref:DUF1003 domain-containing protein n=1 Tax=Devosia sp. TaxID=1871048 RepID=UPI001AD0D907|nr:DUF1003 domain-containing protein [Devosia sp.]MBN9315983.1 DUF1003 domain-containing protein [Devosia sp.]